MIVNSSQYGLCPDKKGGIFEDMLFSGIEVGFVNAEGQKTYIEAV